MDLRELELQALVEKDHLAIHLEPTPDMVHLLDQVDRGILLVPDLALEDLVVPALDKVDLVDQTLDKEDLVDLTLDKEDLVVQTQLTLVMELLEVVLVETIL